MGHSDGTSGNSVKQLNEKCKRPSSNPSFFFKWSRIQGFKDSAKTKAADQQPVEPSYKTNMDENLMDRWWTIKLNLMSDQSYNSRNIVFGMENRFACYKVSLLTWIKFQNKHGTGINLINNSFVKFYTCLLANI